MDQCRDSEWRLLVDTGEWCLGNAGGCNIAGLPWDGAAFGGAGGLSRRAGDRGAIMAMRSLEASRVPGVNGTPSLPPHGLGSPMAPDSTVPFVGLKSTVLASKLSALGAPPWDVLHWPALKEWVLKVEISS